MSECFLLEIKTIHPIQWVSLKFRQDKSYEYLQSKLIVIKRLTFQ